MPPDAARYDYSISPPSSDESSLYYFAMPIKSLAIRGYPVSGMLSIMSEASSTMDKLA